ncbi:MAG: 2-oxoglutarate oxidoreductase [SAR324 cluster bacterium]|nr:2-oxoglutarate oxidoreductase [SAR324 cluster bacterium]
MFGLSEDCILEVPEEYYTLKDYEGNVPRWCPGCGDNTVLTVIQRLCRDRQLPPEKTVFVSGIGCSSRFPHYMKTYGFHGLHGRAFPVAEGIKFRRPDLHVFVATGDGDCCSIGAGHWVHAVRYNMDITVMLLDNEIYGLTKKQTSPTSRIGTKSNTHPKGSILPAINPLTTTLGISNVSFVAQTADWNPPHMYATLMAAHEHKGFSFVRILQRCPHFNADAFETLAHDADASLLLRHQKGIQMDAALEKRYPNILEHDPSDLNKAREVAGREDKIPLGLLYQNTSNACYNDYGAHNMGFTIEQKKEALNRQLDRYAV